MRSENFSEWRRGVHNGMPVCFGYFAVSFALGIQCAEVGLTALQALIMSVTNMTSAGEFAALAIKNEGTIFNCKVVIENATIQKLGIYAGVAVYNDGLIKNVMAKCSFSKVLYLEEQAKDKIGGVKAGGVCAFNYGEVDSCVAVTGFNGFDETEKDGQYGSSESNSYIGALIGSDNGNGKVKNCLASVEENVYPSDQKNQGIDFLTEEELYSEERLFTQLNFDRKIWELTKYQGSYDFNLQEGEE